MIYVNQQSMHEFFGSSASRSHKAEINMLTRAGSLNYSLTGKKNLLPSFHGYWQHQVTCRLLDQGPQFIAGYQRHITNEALSIHFCWCISRSRDSGLYSTHTFSFSRYLYIILNPQQGGSQNYLYFIYQGSEAQRWSIT